MRSKHVKKECEIFLVCCYFVRVKAYVKSVGEDLHQENTHSFYISLTPFVINNASSTS